VIRAPHGFRHQKTSSARKNVNACWQVYAIESSKLASEVMRDICERENIAPDQVVRHSDNGRPMLSAEIRVNR